VVPTEDREAPHCLPHTSEPLPSACSSVTVVIPFIINWCVAQIYDIAVTNS
jgi:hypothetical protein